MKGRRGWGIRGGLMRGMIRGRSCLVGRRSREGGILYIKLGCGRVSRGRGRGGRWVA